MFDKENLIKELSFKAIRSSGSGGQHVNKVSSKIELTFDLNNTLVLSETQKKRLFRKLQNRLTNEGVLILQCDESRSQHKNKELAITRFLELITEGLKVRKRRIPTKIPKSVIKKRLKSKKQVSDKKANRRKPDID
ncbi:alternative ribosome rescue aminoacyl-tRNA hydrolase ArfB [Tamlana sp. 2_MG-2023]|uniref:alternative ribosome rescue aminoacyl-tRNA hydrolase ArfB n=1 Tax=unclassified Tamlana TaxID=2614803 RepID=UPI0026E48FF9|nr:MULTISPECIES: alternative ribosome rescue aminoacyl-tRNA hydrolase ArfB [unclassified Tamlana]MDO6760594.1 alternative ribosome rescue aminoacyl-tRNA hydrolase ArfB [Tamlana sp. 2_MG-2023]MDO6790850.1 alternative ribosome rescue aminoacyl-tRNA hydrolase ArfB [Tamlana sp. 1_MG-2023]